MPVTARGYNSVRKDGISHGDRSSVRRNTLPTRAGLPMILVGQSLFGPGWAAFTMHSFDLEQFPAVPRPQETGA